VRVGRAALRGSRHDPDGHGFAFSRRAKLAFSGAQSALAFVWRAKRAETLDWIYMFFGSRSELFFFCARIAQFGLSAREARTYFFGARSALKRSTIFVFFPRAKRAGILFGAKRVSLFGARSALTFVRRPKHMFLFRRAMRACICSAREARRNARLDLYFSRGSRRLLRGFRRPWVPIYRRAKRATLFSAFVRRTKRAEALDSICHFLWVGRGGSGWVAGGSQVGRGGSRRPAGSCDFLWVGRG
jgi:hypothetical protein